jgi:hypothetical protein
MEHFSILGYRQKTRRPNRQAILNQTPPGKSETAEQSNVVIPII